MVTLVWSAEGCGACLATKRTLGMQRRRNESEQRLGFPSLQDMIDTGPLMQLYGPVTKLAVIWCDEALKFIH